MTDGTIGTVYDRAATSGSRLKERAACIVPDTLSNGPRTRGRCRPAWLGGKPLKIAQFPPVHHQLPFKDGLAEHCFHDRWKSNTFGSAVSTVNRKRAGVGQTDDLEGRLPVAAAEHPADGHPP
jgi:hypothetical protein